MRKVNLSKNPGGAFPNLSENAFRHVLGMSADGTNLNANVQLGSLRAGGRGPGLKRECLFAVPVDVCVEGPVIRWCGVAGRRRSL